MDEADRLMDASFESDLRSLLTILPSDQRQTLLFSATMTASLVKLQQASLGDAYVFQVCGQLLSQLLQTEVNKATAADMALQVAVHTTCSEQVRQGGSELYCWWGALTAWQLTRYAVQAIRDVGRSGTDEDWGKCWG